MSESTHNLDELGTSAESLSFGDRVMIVLQKQRRTKAWLAEEINISKQAMNYLLNHSVRPKYVESIANVLKLNESWLRDGTGMMASDEVLKKQLYRVPIMPLHELQNLQQCAQIKENYPCVIMEPRPSQQCFAWQLDNASMEPTFKKGSLLIFDQSLTANNGDYVLISLPANDNILFRQYHSDGADIYFKAEDKMYRNLINEPHTIHGTLIEARKMFY